MSAAAAVPPVSVPAPAGLPGVKTVPAPPRVVVRAVLALRRRLLQLADAIVPPQLALFEAISGMAQTHLVAAMAKLRVADLLAEGPKSAAELARQTGTNPDALHRALRALASVNVFALDEKTGLVRNNAVSQGLRAGAPGSLRDFAEYFGTKSNAHAWADVEETIRTGRSAFERVHGTSVWDWFARHPQEERLFADTMVALTSTDAPFVAHAYPFGEVQRVCDVAGGRGTLLAEILLAHPHLHGVLVDAPGVAKSARAFLASKGVAQRAEITSGNMFHAVPAGCDAYLLKDILHDWDDERALAILRNVRRALQPGGRVLLCETIVEPNELLGPGPLVDVHMMTVCGEGRQRSRADFEHLLAQSGFALARVVPTPMTMSVIEGRAV